MKKLGFTVAASSALLLAGVLSPALADVQRFDDSVTDQTGEAGIRWVRVDNSTAALDKVKVVTRVGNMLTGPGDSAPLQQLYIDTKPNDPGPEYRILTGQDIGLYRVDGWRDTGTYIPAQCAGSSHYGGYVGRYPKIQGHYNRIFVAIKRGCIANPAKVRVAVHTYFHPDRGPQDWARARNTFLPWVRR
jgi:hypothetical protein